MTAANSFGSRRNVNILYRTLFFIFLSVLLLLFEERLEQTRIVRQSLNYILSPVYLALDFGVRQHQKIKENFIFTDNQNNQLNQLKEQVLFLQQELWHTQRFIEEERRLRDILSFASNSKNYTAARIIGEELTINNQQMILDKGNLHGIRVGMPVLAKDGLAGQVISVGLVTSRALLITDTRHATPVMVRRNRNRFILNGEGNLQSLYSKDVGSHIDATTGDMLVTSGLGRRFPAGWPVAEILKVRQLADRSFFEVRARPMIRPHILSFVLIYKQGPTGGGEQEQ